MDFARRGAILILAARGKEQLEALVADCNRFGATAITVPTDVTDIKAVEQLAKTAIEKFGHIDVWINNAGVSLFGRLEEVPFDAYRAVIETNLFGYIHGARAVLPYFREQGHGVLINNSSMVGKSGSPFVSAYAISKSGIIGLSNSLRQELIDTPDIHVCTILPASIDTPLFQHAANYTGKAVKPLEPIYDVDMVAQEIVRLAIHPRREVYVGGSGFMLGLMSTLAPPVAERMMAKQVEKNQFTDVPAALSKGNLYKSMPQWSSSSGQWREVKRTNTSARFMAVGIPLLGAGLATWFLYKRGSLSRQGLSEEFQGLGDTVKGAWTSTMDQFPDLRGRRRRKFFTRRPRGFWSKASPRLKAASGGTKDFGKNIRRALPG
jgi:short-subunit dehydrogenase